MNNSMADSSPVVSKGLGNRAREIAWKFKTKIKNKCKSQSNTKSEWDLRYCETYCETHANASAWNSMGYICESCSQKCNSGSWKNIFISYCSVPNGLFWQASPPHTSHINTGYNWSRQREPAQVGQRGLGVEGPRFPKPSRPQRATAEKFIK